MSQLFSIMEAFFNKKKRERECNNDKCLFKLIRMYNRAMRSKMSLEKKISMFGLYYGYFLDLMITKTKEEEEEEDEE